MIFIGLPWDLKREDLFGATNLKKEERGKKIQKSTFYKIIKFSLFNPVLQPSGVPGESQLVVTGW